MGCLVGIGTNCASIVFFAFAPKFPEPLVYNIHLVHSGKKRENLNKTEKIIVRRQ